MAAREYDKIQLRTNTTKIIRLASYLKGFAEIPNISALKGNNAKSQKIIHFVKGTDALDTQIIPTLKIFGLLSVDDLHNYCVTPLGFELLKYLGDAVSINFDALKKELSNAENKEFQDDGELDEDSSADNVNGAERDAVVEIESENESRLMDSRNEDYVRLMLRMFSKWHQRDDAYNRDVHPGILFLRLLCDNRLNYYLTDHEVARITRNKEYRKDCHYELIVRDLLDFRARDGFFSAYTKKLKVDHFMPSLVNTWKIMKSVPLSFSQIENCSREGVVESYRKSLTDFYDEEIAADEQKFLLQQRVLPLPNEEITLGEFRDYLNGLRDCVDHDENEMYAKILNKRSVSNLPDDMRKFLARLIERKYYAKRDAEVEEFERRISDGKSAVVTEYSLTPLAFHIALGYLQSMDLDNPEDTPNQKVLDSDPLQKIIFGAPGTGKSKSLKKEVEEKFGESCIERVTFHPNYSYAHFVGTYKPVGEDSNIAYKFVEGPFIRTYVKAYLNPDVKYVLVIEEINRANVAAVFGDVFQLLDRDENGFSEYPVDASEDLRKYLIEKSLPNCKKLSIPSNMYIWATMNSADQGVMPMDTAFKRRWEFEYKNLDCPKGVILPSCNKTYEEAKLPFFIGENPREYVTWELFRVNTNNALKACKVNEDKCLGPFFINMKKLDEVNVALSSLNELGDEQDDESKKKKDLLCKNVNYFKTYFANKVLMYLFEDAGRICRNSLFNSRKNDDENGNVPQHLSDLCSDFNVRGCDIFNKNFWKNK